MIVPTIAEGGPIRFSTDNEQLLTLAVFREIPGVTPGLPYGFNNLFKGSGKLGELRVLGKQLSVSGGVYDATRDSLSIESNDIPLVAEAVDVVGSHPIVQPGKMCECARGPANLHIGYARLLSLILQEAGHVSADRRMRPRDPEPAATVAAYLMKINNVTNGNSLATYDYRQEAGFANSFIVSMAEKSTVRY